MGDHNVRIGNNPNGGLGNLGDYGEKQINRNVVKTIYFSLVNDLIFGTSFCE